jgi:ribulose-5-phosphate 4-epimerase/fuculose-1-phosphate aldolase
MSQLEDLVAAYRILAEFGIIDAYGHVSVRSETDPGRYLIARSLAPELVTAEDIIENELDSGALHDTRDQVRERFIHGEVYKLRPEVNSVVHNHSPAVVPFSVTQQPLRPIFHMAAFVGLGVPVFEIRDVEQGTDLLVKTAKLGQALAAVLGDKPAALMRGHGAVVVGENVQRAVGRSIYLEISARMQLQAMTIAGPGGSIAYLDEAEVRAATNMQDYGRAWPMWREKALQKLREENGSTGRKAP